jgi:hypothetical protein
MEVYFAPFSIVKLKMILPYITTVDVVMYNDGKLHELANMPVRCNRRKKNYQMFDLRFSLLDSCNGHDSL